MVDKGIPRHGYEVVDAAGNVIGQITSGTMSIMLHKGVGMAYIDKPYWKEGSEIYIKVRNKQLKAVVTRPPFFKA